MAVKIVMGDLLKASEDVIGHQVNCKGVMGSGVADQVKKKYPEVFKEYKDYIKERLHTPFGVYAGRPVLGMCQLVRCRDGKIVANLFGQEDYNRGFFNWKKMTDEASLKTAIQQLKNVCKKEGWSVALPYKIGSDRGGADWNVVEKMINEIFSDYDITLYKYSER